MKKFFYKLIIFFVGFGIIGVVGLVLPATPRASKSLLFAKLKKDALLKNIESDRIIFIGGSNLSFGLDSEIIKKSLSLNPINTGIHASIGLIYMLDSVEKKLKRGDIIVVCAEYQTFFADVAMGAEELSRLILEIAPLELTNLRYEQLLAIAKHIPKYAFSKFKPEEYFWTQKSDIYGIDSFNEYGDAYGHWGLPNRTFEPFSKIEGDYNPIVIDRLSEFELVAKEKGAVTLITFPPIERISYENNIDEIAKVFHELQKARLKIIGSPEKYRMENHFFFDTPYHLNRAGIDIRTRLLLEDLQSLF